MTQICCLKINTIEMFYPKWNCCRVKRKGNVRKSLLFVESWSRFSLTRTFILPGFCGKKACPRLCCVSSFIQHAPHLSKAYLLSDLGPNKQTDESQRSHLKLHNTIFKSSNIFVPIHHSELRRTSESYWIKLETTTIITRNHLTLLPLIL